MKRRQNEDYKWRKRRCHVSLTCSHWLCLKSAATKQSGSRLHVGKALKGTELKDVTGSTGRGGQRRDWNGGSKLFCCCCCYRPRLLCKVATSRTGEKPVSNLKEQSKYQLKCNSRTVMFHSITTRNHTEHACRQGNADHHRTHSEEPTGFLLETLLKCIYVYTPCRVLVSLTDSRSKQQQRKLIGTAEVHCGRKTAGMKQHARSCMRDDDM